MKKLLILFSIILLCTSNAFSQQLPRIAVFVAVNENDCEEVRQTKRILGTRLVESIARSNLFTAVERSDRFFNEIMRAQNIQGGGHVRDDQIIERARISGEQYVIVADVTRFRGEDFVEARMLEVLSGNVLGIPASSGRQIRNMQDLITISDEVSNRLIRQTPQYTSRQRAIDDQRRRQQEEATRLAQEQQRRADSITRVEQQRRVRTEQLRQNQFCNRDTPGWGNSLGTVSFVSNQTWTIGNQTWSDAVTATACANRTTFNGGNIDDFNADCRNSVGNNNFNSHYFSWCAVRRFANQLCPAPWRVPTRNDFIVLDNALGGRGAAPDQYFTRWQGARFTGHADDLTNANVGSRAASHYWSSTEQSPTSAFHLSFSAHSAMPENWNVKSYGFALRCVR